MTDIDITDTLKHNPAVDPVVFAEVLRVHEELVKAGLKRKHNRIALPYGKRRIVVGDPDNKDSRVKRLSSRQTN